jgi:hypothetical protein
MITVKCIGTLLDENHKVFAYRIMDTEGNIKCVSPEQLKADIANKQIQVDNIALTSDGRIIRRKENLNTKSKDSTSEIIIVDKQQPLLHDGFARQLYEAKKLQFKLVKSISDFYNVSKLMGKDPIRLTDDLYAVYDGSVANIISDVPVRILSAETCGAILSMFYEIDLENTDLSHLNYSLEGYLSNNRLEAWKKFNSNIISKYKYSCKSVELFDNKRADSYLDIAEKIFHVITWSITEDHTAINLIREVLYRLVASIGKDVGLDRLAFDQIYDLLDCNWSYIENNCIWMGNEHISQWAISRMIASGNFMKYFDRMLDDIPKDNYAMWVVGHANLALTEENLRRLLNSNIATIDEVRSSIFHYGKTEFLNELELIMEFFREKGDYHALTLFEDIYDCIDKYI